MLKLVSLVNSEDRSLSEYHGLLTIKKLPAVNSLAFHIPPGTDWAFKLRKRRFIIEVSLNLRIDLSFFLSKATI